MAYRRVEELLVRAWGDEVGILYAHPSQPGRFLFEYAPTWVQQGVDLAPLSMRFRAADPQGPPADRTDEDRGTWHGVPALLADSVPDDFGNRVIDSALAREGLRAEDITALDRLAYVGKRGMGALTFHPSREPAFTPTVIEMRDLVEEARAVLSGSLHADERTHSLRDIIMTGTSAGGARAKAVIAWNPQTNEVRPGNIPLPEGTSGFEQWLVKFDGVRKGDYELKDSTGYTTAEYVYSLMAREAGVAMPPTQLLPEGPRAHFMTKRFDRPDTEGTRLHLQTLNALATLNYKYEGVHSYESLLTTAQSVGADSPQTLEQIFRLAVFNVLASNNDDHTKNVSFLMDRRGQWSLAPAYDLSYAHQPGHRYIGQHLMSINGKFAGHTLDDLRALGLAKGWMVPDVEGNIERVAEAVSQFPRLAREWEVPVTLTDTIQRRIASLFRDVGLTDPTP